MKGNFSVSVTMSTGNSGTSIVFETFNDIFQLAKKKFSCDLKVWKSQADKDNGKEHTYLFGSETIKNLSYDIPQADLDQAVTDGHFGIIGQNHVDYFKTELATLLSINTTDISITDMT